MSWHTGQVRVTFFLDDPSVRYKQYKTTAGMYINKSATRTGKKNREVIKILCHIYVCRYGPSRSSLYFLMVSVPVALMNNLCAGLSYPLDLWSSTHSGFIILALQEIIDARIKEKRGRFKNTHAHAT